MGRAAWTVDDLWIERAAARLGFDRLAKGIGLPGKGPYLLILAVVVVHVPVLSVIGWTQTGTLSMAVNRGELLVLPAWPAVVWIMRRTKRRYAQAVADLPDLVDDDIDPVSGRGTLPASLLDALGIPANPRSKADANLEEIAPHRLKVGILLPGLALYGTQLLLDPATLVGPITELAGPFAATVRFYLIIPFVLYPIGAEFIALVLGAVVLLPLKIRRARIVDFSDPHGFAGLAPAGELFKSVTVSYFVLLTLFTTFLTVAEGTSPTELFSSVLVLGGLGLGLVLFIAPLLWMKQYLRAAKRAKIDVIVEGTRRIGSTDEILPYVEPETGDDATQYVYNHIRMSRIEMARDIPVDTGALREVLFALVLPYTASLVFDHLLGTL